MILSLPSLTGADYLFLMKDAKHAREIIPASEDVNEYCFAAILAVKAVTVRRSARHAPKNVKSLVFTQGVRADVETW